MKLKEQWNRGGWPRVLAAFALNALFLLVMLTLFAPRFETNDDLLMSKFVDGQLSEKTAYVPFLNICQGLLLKALYTLLGDGFNWYTACQYLLLLLGFTAITWTLLRRFPPLPALVMTAVILGAFGADCYLSMNFSKPAAVGTVGGMSLMLLASEGAPGRARRLPMALGLLLALAGYCWRFEEFGVCALLMAAVCLRGLIGVWAEAGGLAVREKLRRGLRFLAPFVLLAVLAVGLFGVNSLAWHRPEIADYKRFDDTRSILIDFEIPEYEQMPEVYDELGMDENFVYLMRNWSFYDTEKFTQESMDRLIAARDAYVPRRTLGECLGVFLNRCLMGFTQDRPFAGFAFLLVLWLACGRRRGRDWAALACLLGLFCMIYLLMIYLQRFLANRVDIGLFLAMAVALSFLLDKRRLEKERVLLLAVLLLSLFVSWRACRGASLIDRHAVLEDKSAERAAVARLLEDEEHLYFVKVWSVDHELYTPLETAPAGYAERLVHIGGWSMHHPVIERLLRRWEVENPYPDLIDREELRLIDNDIERTLAYLRRYYCPTAEAERIEPLSSETGYQIYRITG